MSDKQRQKMEHQGRPVLGADLPAHERPGVPMETAPHALTPTAPEQVERQRPRRGITKRSSLRQFTPVFGTGQPLHGVSGLIRRLAYSVRETHARHWMMLLMADRVDILEHRIAKLVKLAAVVALIAALIWLGTKLLGPGRPAPK